jgi:osmotically-inducible protein OsmY
MGQPGWNRGMYEGESQGTGGFRGGMSGPYTGRGPKGYKRSDERIKEEVSDHLEQNGMIDASEIQVEVQNGVVTLQGSVESRQMKRMAEDLVENCPGVKDVHNHLRMARGDGDETGQGGRTTKDKDTRKTA